jgi:hypothetical protein
VVTSVTTEATAGELRFGTLGGSMKFRADYQNTGIPSPAPAEFPMYFNYLG